LNIDPLRDNAGRKLMPGKGHNIIVIGTSAGGLEALGLRPLEKLIKDIFM
jgi:chemotaxis response regulator CheB